MDKLKNWALLSILILVSLAIWGVPILVWDILPFSEKNAPTSEITLSSEKLAAEIDKKEEVLNYYLNGLIACESGYNPNAWNANDNGNLSAGILQFKISTFNYYGSKFNLLHNDIMNPEQQIAIAKAILLNEKNGWKHWSNCAKKTGLNLIEF